MNNPNNLQLLDSVRLAKGHSGAALDQLRRLKQSERSPELDEAMRELKSAHGRLTEILKAMMSNF